MDQEKVSDAEILESISGDQAGQEEKYASRDRKIEIALILILGLLAGFTAKSEAAKRITIGYDDYKLVESASDYDLVTLEKQLVESQSQSQQPAQPQE